MMNSWKLLKSCKDMSKTAKRGKVPRECCEKVECSKLWANFGSSDPEKHVVFTWVLDSS